MAHPCIACGGSGYGEHVDRTLPPPPCRLCRPDDARKHVSLARDTRRVSSAERQAMYDSLRQEAVEETAPLAG